MPLHYDRHNETPVNAAAAAQQLVRHDLPLELSVQFSQY